MVLAQWGLWTRWFVVAVVLVATGCVEPHESFRCTDSSQCGTGATCEAAGFCSFDDTTCPSGRRYGEFASESLSETCVINPNGDFDISAVSASNTSITVTFTGAPDPAAAVVLGNYAVNGLVLSGTPTLTGSSVTITSAAQSGIDYTLTASGITRASDAAPLWISTSTFPGRAAFDVTSAASATNSLVQVTFQSAPDPTTGTNLANYSIPGLTLSGTPLITGNTVTLLTSPQSAISYTVTVTGVLRAGDTEPLTVNSASFTGRIAYNLVSAASLTSTSVLLTFDAAPHPVEATTLANYSIPGLTLSGLPILLGDTVMLSTSAQAMQSYTVTVSGVTRDSDAEPLLVAARSFNGISTFNVASAASTTSVRMTVTFDQAPNMAQAVVLANYSVPGLTLSGTPMLSGNTVTLITSTQSAIAYTVTVSNVTRGSDGEAMAITTAMFTGRTPFNVASASSNTSTSVQVTFSDPPNMTQATTLANYSIPGLTLSGTPMLSGNTVTLSTTTQSAISYTVTVANVRRDSDAEALTTTTADFPGRVAFNVLSVVAVTNTSVRVTFDAAPTLAQAQAAGNYAITGGLTVSGATLTGNAVLLTTNAQVMQTYTLTVTGVTRAADGEMLAANSGNFTGIPPFNVASALATTNTRVTVTFNGAPDPTTATTASNYTISNGVTVTGIQGLSGNTVTLITSAQIATTYSVTVANTAAGVTRAADGEPLTLASTTFAGRAPFDVNSAASTAHRTVSVVFSHPPTLAQAQNIANYTITGGAGLTVSAAVLSGSTVTLTTSAQSAITYTVTVASVLRLSDSEALTTNARTFTGRAAFNVASAASVSNTRITVTFSAPPLLSQANVVANYTLTGNVTVTSFVSLVGSTVTLNTTSQSAVTYTVTVAGVTRASDLEALTGTSTTFAGRAQFNVTAAASTTNLQMTVTFSHPPTLAAAQNAANYTLTGGLTVSNAVLSGSTVTLTTSAQVVQAYTVTVNTAVTRASDGELLNTRMANFTGKTGFNVSSAASVNSFTVTVTFDAAPNAVAATTLGSYSANNGLVFSGTPMLSGNTVTLTSSKQATQTYTVTVTGVTRASDNNPLQSNTANFSHVAFNVASAVSLSTSSISVTFDAAPNLGEAQTSTNYTLSGGLTVTGAPVLSGTTVTIPTSVQAAQPYTVTAANVTRASDGAVLTNGDAVFTGRAPFDVASAAATSSGTMTVTFSHPPNAAATTQSNYSVNNGLTLSNPQLAGSTVTFTTTAQMGVTYTVSVSGVIRSSDNEPLSITDANFAGIALAAPTVTNVVIQSTSPDNGTAKYFNTGSVTVVITGTEFTDVNCSTGLKLDDLNGAGGAVNTGPTTCTVDSGTQITATFPAGIRTNGTTGWNVKVTNAVTTNSTSTVRLVPHAGLLLSEVYIGKSGPGGDREYIELFNPTGLSINVATLVIQGTTGLRLHIRNASGTDVSVTPTYLRSVVPAGGYLLLASTASSAGNGEDWYDIRDGTYSTLSTQLEPGSGVYVSWSATASSMVLDKLGWGGVLTPWIETTGFGTLSFDFSTQRRPGGASSTTDTDVNSADWLPQSTILGFRNSLGQM